MNARFAVAAAAIACASVTTSASAVTFMDAAWASSACSAWNSTPALANDLGGDKWAANDGGRGYKIIQMYRIKCGEGSKVVMETSRSKMSLPCEGSTKPAYPWEIGGRA